MKIFYDDDADISIIQNLKVTIVGYGSQGHAHANNLHESGVEVTVALREGSSSWSKAENAGLRVAKVAEAVSDADIVMILAPDEFQLHFLKKVIKLEQLSICYLQLQVWGLIIASSRLTALKFLLWMVAQVHLYF